VIIVADEYSPLTTSQIQMQMQGPPDQNEHKGIRGAGTVSPERDLPAGLESAVFSATKLERNTLDDAVYEQLKQAIMSGVIAPGSPMTIRSLANSFGISEMPVRQALRRLVAEHVLIFRRNRTVGLPIITEERFSEITLIRQALEGLAAETAAPLLAQEEIGRMAQLNDSMEASSAAGSFLAQNRDFHFILYRACKMPILIAMIETLWLQIGPLLTIHQSNYTAKRKPVHTQHRRILDALQQRDAKAVREAIEMDIGDAAQVIAPRL
jgi:DNA-binding GntR family transcriptional regulator